MDIITLKEFAKANCHLVQCENKFIQARRRRNNNLQWTPRMTEFMMPIWKMRSKIEDEEESLQELVEAVLEQMYLANTLADGGTEIAASGLSEQNNKIKDIFRQTEALFSVYSSTKLQILKNYNRKVIRMLTRVQQEEKSYFFPQGNSFRIMNPDLNLDVIQKFILYAVHTAGRVLAINNQYSRIYKSFLDIKKELYGSDVKVAAEKPRLPQPTNGKHRKWMNCCCAAAILFSMCIFSDSGSIWQSAIRHIQHRVDR